MKLLLIDNNDSFTYNLQHLLATCGFDVTVKNYYDDPFDSLKNYDGIVISPGPGNPSWYPKYRNLFEVDMPIMGICLGMQIINVFFGGKAKRAPKCFHGKTDLVYITYRKSWLRVARYHSLYCSEVPPSLKIISYNKEGIPMGIAHRKRRIIAFQFHPESFLTEDGPGLMEDVRRFWVGRLEI